MTEPARRSRGRPRTSPPKRARKGSGSVRKRGNTWTAYWHATDPITGVRGQRTKGGFSTQAEAQSYLASRLAEAVAGTYRRNEPLTVKQLLEDHWLPAKRAENKAPATIAGYEGAALWVTRRIGAVRLEALTPRIVAHMVEDLRTLPTERHRKDGSIQYGSSGLGPRSVQAAVGTLKAATAWAARMGKVARDPLADVRRPGLPKPAVGAWDADQSRMFLASVADDRLLVGWTLLLTRGLRRGELAGLRWSAVNIDAEEPHLRVIATRVVVNGSVLHSRPKAGSDRLVPLSPRLVSLLRDHRGQQAHDAEVARGAYFGAGYVMADALGRPMHPDSIGRRFDVLVARVGLPRLTPRELRHTCATLMLQDGEPTKLVADMLGNTVEVVLNYYAASLPGMATKAGERLDEALLA